MISTGDLHHWPLGVSEVRQEETATREDPHFRLLEKRMTRTVAELDARASGRRGRQGFRRRGISPGAEKGRSARPNVNK